jgi:hypothetical protein
MRYCGEFCGEKEETIFLALNNVNIQYLGNENGSEIQLAFRARANHIGNTAHNIRERQILGVDLFAQNAIVGFRQQRHLERRVAVVLTHYALKVIVPGRYDQREIP